MRSVPDMEGSRGGGKDLVCDTLRDTAFGRDSSLVSAVSASHDRSRRCEADGVDRRVFRVSNRSKRYFVRIFHWSRSGFSENAGMQESAPASYIFFRLYQAVIPDERSSALLSGIKRREKRGHPYGSLFAGRLCVALAD